LFQKEWCQFRRSPHYSPVVGAMTTASSVL
jgi:hypothetical protein